MHLTQVGEARTSSGKISMPDKRACVGITVHPVALDHADAVPDRLAEAMAGIGGDRDHNSVQNEVIHCRSHAPLTRHLEASAMWLPEADGRSCCASAFGILSF